MTRGDKRPGWDEYFMEIAEITAKRSTCMRRSVGAVIVRDRHVMTAGYNGAPRGVAHCEERGGCLRERMGIPSGERHELCMALHAEQNAIIQAAALGQSIEGAAIYITHQPCVICAKMIINAGIKRIIVREGYPDQLSVDILAEAGLKIVIIGSPE
jgi:dCMP deaminase